MYKFLIILATVAFCSCTIGNSSNAENTKNDAKGDGTVKTVTIRSGGNSTVYKVNNNNLVTESSFINQYGSENKRSYSYDESKELQSIEKNNSVTGTEHVYFSTEKSRDGNNKITQKVKTISNSRGQSTSLTVEYYYDDNGEVIGMVQKDSNGNIVAKGINN